MYIRVGDNEILAKSFIRADEVTVELHDRSVCRDNTFVIPKGNVRYNCLGNVAVIGWNKEIVRKS